MAVRAAILRHELSHGQFFSDPDYADYTRRFWRTALTEPERAGVRHFLGSQDYDTADEELMLNEMQAYLMFTLDPHFFSAADIGMTAATARAAPGRVPARPRRRLAARRHEASADRRGDERRGVHGTFGSVSTSITVPVTLAPLRRAVSIAICNRRR